MELGLLLSQGAKKVALDITYLGSMTCVHFSDSYCKEYWYIFLTTVNILWTCTNRYIEQGESYVSAHRSSSERIIQPHG